MPIVVLQGLFGSDESESVAREVEAFRLVGTESSIQKFFLREGSFDSAILGHEELQLTQGPLTVAALGWDPPERSTEFHLSLLSTFENNISDQLPTPTDEESQVLKQELQKLNTKAMTILFGEGLDHGLVWEKRVEFLTHTPQEAAQKGLKECMPEGDFENDLRRMIDDSINILSEQEFNLRRADKGIKPINLVWPWGQGERQRVPNLALKMGYPWRIYSSSLAIRGLSRLSCLRAERLPFVDRLDLKKLTQSLKHELHSMAIIDLSSYAGEERLEEKAYKSDEIGKGLIQPLLDWQRESKESLVIVATNPSGDGVIANIQSKPSERDDFPFDERAITERKVPELALSSLLTMLD